MSQLTPHPAYLLIEDTLDAIGQKYRGLRIVRGFLLALTAAIAASIAAGLSAHFAGAGRIAQVTFVAWVATLVLASVVWVLRPLLLRPRPVEMARLVETRIPELHNGLTNSVLLARSADLQSSPFLGPIFDEIWSVAQDKPLSSAVSAKDLKPAAVRLAIAAGVLAILLLIPATRGALQQGWRQMLNPATFVPKVGAVKLIDVSPKQVTLVAGQPLEISILAEDPAKGLPAAKLIFDGARPTAAELQPTLTADDQLKYAYRLDRVEESMRWRVEVGGSQSEWCTVTVVKQVKLQELVLSITPPSYTNRTATTVTLKAEDIHKTPVSVLEGSRVEISALIDVPVKSALLQIDQEQPQPMAVAQAGQRFSHAFHVTRAIDVSVLCNENGQIIAKLPDPALKIACTKDAPPVIEMKWPTQDVAVAPKAELKLHAMLKDDHGLTAVRVLLSTTLDQPLAVVHSAPLAGVTQDFTYVLSIPDDVRVHGRSVKVQLDLTDNRNLTALSLPSKDTGPQTTGSPVFELKFRDPEEIAKEQKEQADKLRHLLQEMLKLQQALHSQSVAWKGGLDDVAKVNQGQTELHKMMALTAETFPFDADDRIVQKTLLVLIAGPAKDAIDLSGAIKSEQVVAEQVKLNKNVQAKQRRIIEVLETLLARLANPTQPTTQPSRAGGDLENEKEKLKDLNEALKKFIAEEKRILDAAASLAKKPVDNFDDNDKKLLEELKMAQEKLDTFMAEKIADFSKLAEQDMANASLLKEMMEVYSEVTMAKDALKKNAVDMSIPLEEMGLELAKEISSNLEKWLSDKPDREKWNQEDPLGKVDVPMAELPKELEDMIGELLEQQEDLFEEMEDTAANFADSLDKGAGWDAMDGPIANMSAKGVTGNQLPNNNEMNGRSGEGRSGKSQGEFVEETASGKGGRNTPTRLDPTPFQQGQVKDTSKDPVGGATGGGKVSGQGGQGLEGPVPPKDLREQMERLAGKQAELRNKAEKLQLDRKAAAFDNFKLMEAIANMRRVESDIHANRYGNALRRKDVVLDSLDTSHLLLSGQLHLQRDTTPTVSDRLEDQLKDITTGTLPAAWSEALKEYYKKLAQQ